MKKVEKPVFLSGDGTATLGEVAAACNLTPQRIGQLVKDGIIPRESRGQYKLLDVLTAYVRYLQDALSKKSSMDEDGNVTSTKDQRIALLSIQAEREALHLARERGEVMAIADHEKVLADLIIETRARILAVSGGLAARVIGEQNRNVVQGTIEKHLEGALSQLAKLTPQLPDGARAETAPAAD